MQINVRTDGSELSRLLEAAERGEEVILARDHLPVAKLVSVKKANPETFRFDMWADLVEGPIPDFEPMTDEELDRLEQEKEQRIAHGIAGDPA